MNDRERYRLEIDEIDRKMAELFVNRMKISGQIAEYKRINGLAIVDKKRENDLIEKNSNYIKEDVIKEYYVLFLKDIMKYSASYQFRLNQGMKIAYTGVEGAFAYIAAKKMFPGANYVSCADFSSSYQQVVDSRCDVAVLPIENSTAGDVGLVMDLTYCGNLFINRIVDIPIEQNLLAVPGTSKKDIKTVYSHQQALAQCAEYIHEHKFIQKECINTAVAAKEVAELKDKSIAAIASAETAGLYGLDIVERNINTNKANFTRFACFSRILNKNASDGFIIVFSVTNEAGSLAKALDIIGSNGFNMRNLRSRPIKSKMWKYYFYTEIEGNVFSESGSDLMIQLKTICDEVKLVGTYSMQ